MRATSLAPTSGHLLGGFAMLLAKQGVCDRAELYFRRGLDMDPSNPDLLGNFSSFYHRQRNNVPMAIEVVKKALKICPKHCNNLSKYATLLKQKGPKFYDDAEMQYQLACKLPDASATVLCNYATFLYVVMLVLVLMMCMCMW